MSVVNELINAQGESLEFGNYELGAKTKKDGFEFQGDIYKIKTFNEITKLRRTECSYMSQYREQQYMVSRLMRTMLHL